MENVVSFSQATLLKKYGFVDRTAYLYSNKTLIPNTFMIDHYRDLAEATIYTSVIFIKAPYISQAIEFLATKLNKILIQKSFKQSELVSLLKELDNESS